ncbi:transposase [Pseudomonas capeferrum]|nr:transposase [Pseudomonas capeferrum]
MPYDSSERKTEPLKMLLPPLSLTMAEVARREGVIEMSLSNWRKQARAKGCEVADPHHSAESWSVEMKFSTGSTRNWAPIGTVLLNPDREQQYAKEAA